MVVKKNCLQRAGLGEVRVIALRLPVQKFNFLLKMKITNNSTTAKCQPNMQINSFTNADDNNCQPAFCQTTCWLLFYLSAATFALKNLLHNTLLYFHQSSSNKRAHINCRQQYICFCLKLIFVFQ